ncbi:MAG: FAD-dependent oxidoreductase [Acidimicrobiia bacterium]
MEDNPTVADLTPDQLAILEQFGERRAVAAGEVLFAAGDPGYSFYVVLSGAVDIIGLFDGVETVIVQHGPGRFLGELNLLTGQRVYLTGRVAEAGEVIAIPPDEFRRLIATVPAVSDTILATLVLRRTLLLEGASKSLRVIGSRYSSESLAMREFLVRNRLPHQWLDVDTDTEVDRLVAEFGLAVDDLPVVITGTEVVRRATPGGLAQLIGMTIESIPERCFDLVIVGAGPAGLAASVYGASEGLTTLTVESIAPGGQAGTSSRIENYLGFPQGVSGNELTNLAMTQALKFGARLTTPCEVAGLKEVAGHLTVFLSDGTELAGRAVIVATGAQYRRLRIPRLEEFEGTGVYYAATEVEARLVGDAPTVVVGGGNSAGQAAIFLAESGSPVTLLIRGEDLSKSMSSYLADRIHAHPNITVRTESECVALHGDEMLTGITVTTASGDVHIEAVALFSFIGADPGSGWLAGNVAVDANGFLRTDRSLTPEDLGEEWESLGRTPLPFETSQPGLFAVGDVRSGSVKRVASAVGEGSAAIRSVHEHLSFVLS